MSYSATSKRRNITKSKCKVMDDHDEFLSRIKKTLYYGKLPLTQRFSLPVSELAAELFTEVKREHSIQRLDLGEAAAISRRASVSPCSLVLALLYLDRLKSCDSGYLQRVAPPELFVISMMVASKFLNDDGEENEVFNDEWAASAGIDVKEINRFERDFLQAIGWEVYVGEKAFWTRLSGLEKDVALREGKRRGWFSYTDLDLLLEHMDLAALAQAVISISAVCLTSYTASVLTLIGSALIVSHIPGTSLSSSISTSLTNLPAQSSVNLLGTLPMNSSIQDLPPVNLLTADIILASVSSYKETNNYQSITNVHGLKYYRKLFSKETAHGLSFHNRNKTDFNDIQMAVNYFAWQWWRNEVIRLLSFYTGLNGSVEEKNIFIGRPQELIRSMTNETNGRGESEIDFNEIKIIDSISSVTREAQEWVSVIKSWLDCTMLGKSRQALFFQQAASNSYLQPQSK